MELVEDFGTKVNQCSEIKEHVNIFCNTCHDHSLAFNQCLL